MIRSMLFWVGLFAITGTSVEAATLYMSPQSIELNRADSATIAVRLDVDEDECINAIDAVITFPPEIVPVDISRGRSILSLWIEEPTIDLDTQTITFAGGIPNGYCGRIVGDPRLTNNVIDIVVQSPSFVVSGGGSATTTAATLSFAPETQLLLNDNIGSRAEANLFGTTVTLTQKAGQGDSEWLDLVASDTMPPNSFVLTLQRTPNAFSNQYFITFNTTDKQTGISHYEVIEEPLDELPFFNFEWARQDAPWMKARSPYVLKDQSLNSVIRVRAIDKAGNEYVASLTPEEEDRTMSQASQVLLLLIGAVMVTFLIVVGLGSWLYLYRRKRSRRAAEERVREQSETTNEESEEAE